MSKRAFSAACRGLVLLVSIAVPGCDGNSTPPKVAAGPSPAATPISASDLRDKGTPAANPQANADAADTAQITLRAVDPQDYAEIVAAHQGKVVLVDFWATWCVPCRKQFPNTVKLHRELASEGLVAISVSCDAAEKEAAALTFLKSNQATFENLRSQFGGDEETYSGFEIEGGAIPHYKLYDRTGKLRHVFGSDPTAEKQFTHADIEERVRELLAEKPSPLRKP